MKKPKNIYLTAGLVLTCLVLAVAMVGIFWTPYAPTAMKFGRFQPPSFQHLFGTDNFGRDIFSRVLKGTGTTLGIALSTVTLGALLGTVTGALTGYYGGWLDEALMRLNLEKTGLVFPNQFIPIAEENGFIHVLTEIILHKTCRQIRLLTTEGYLFSRISVNIVAEELQSTSFCDDVMRIIHYNGSNTSQIALELTESENENDFLVTKKRIMALKEEGIKFYLDDFGTGYSSLERILQLPFDIIKFDRTMVIASRTDSKSSTIVKSMAQLFADLNYSILFEGIEDKEDEKRCCSMSASYLQGYLYSKPVPIDEMTRYFTKKSEALSGQTL